MSETSLDNAARAGAAVEPKQGLGDSGSEEQNSLGGPIGGRGAGPGVLSGMLTVDQIAWIRWQVLPCRPTGHHRWSRTGSTWPRFTRTRSSRGDSTSRHGHLLPALAQRNPTRTPWLR